MTKAIVLDESKSTVTIQNEVQLATTTLQIIEVDLKRPYTSKLRDEAAYHLDLSLSPRTKTEAHFSSVGTADGFKEAGTLFLIPPGEEVHTQTEVGRDVILICRLPIETVSSVCDSELRWSLDQLYAGMDIRFAPMTLLMQRLARELISPGFASSTLIDAIMIELAVELLRYRTMIDERSIAGLPAWRLQLIDDYLLQHIRPSLAQLAAECGLSVRHLSRAFRLSRGMPLGQYAAQMQLRTAKSRLASGESVKSVAYSTGFSSPAAFCQAFRRATGETPGQYRGSIGKAFA